MLSWVNHQVVSYTVQNKGSLYPIFDKVLILRKLVCLA